MTGTGDRADVSSWFLACPLSSFDGRTIVAVSHCDRHIILLRDGDRIVATERACPHEGADLARGRCLEGKLYCPRHYAWFDLIDGKVSPGWTFDRLRIYATRIIEQNVWVAIS